MLGGQLSSALTNLTQLIVKTKDKKTIAVLMTQHEKLADELQALVDQMVDEEMPEYDAAANALEDANEAAIAAKADLDKVAQAITRMAKAIDKVAALAAKVAAA